MKLSQFKFKLPESQVALYPHSFEREFTNDDGTKGSFRVTRRASWCSTAPRAR